MGGPEARRLVASWRIRARGSWIMSVGGYRLYVWSSDPRARAMELSNGALDARAIRAWKQVCDHVDPTLVVDVGANYAEVALSRRYPGQVRIHLVEANPRLCKMLARTAAAVSGDVHIELHEVAAGDRAGEATLFTSPESSGLSSVSRVVGAAEDAVGVPLRRVDSIVSAEDGDRIAFKIDVEGYEAPALSGMSGLLEGRTFAGLVELPSTDVERRALIELIERQFTAKRISLTGEWITATARDLECRWPDKYTKDVILLPR